MCEVEGRIRVLLEYSERAGDTDLVGIPCRNLPVPSLNPGELDSYLRSQGFPVQVIAELPIAYDDKTSQTLFFLCLLRDETAHLSFPEFKEGSWVTVQEAEERLVIAQERLALDAAFAVFLANRP